MRRLTIILMTAGMLLGLRGQSDAPAFEVASVKRDRRHSWVRRPWSPDINCSPVGHCGVSGNRFTEEFASLDDLIMDAYAVRRYQIAGLPEWGDTGADVYDVEARAEEGRTLTLAEARRMLQTLLAERFQLKIHRETRELPVYALVIAKGGPKLKPSNDVCQLPSSARALSPEEARARADATRPFFLWTMMTERLSDRAGRPVIDKTGFDAPIYCTLDGQDAFYALMKELGPGSGGRGKAPAAAAVASDSDFDHPSIFSVIERQWGLKLESQKAPVEIIVIDRVERPSEN